ncbi:MAG: hypothetical protein WEB58_02610, partial [Planctomycetaceae bacterium]
SLRGRFFEKGYAKQSKNPHKITLAAATDFAIAAFAEHLDRAPRFRGLAPLAIGTAGPLGRKRKTVSSIENCDMINLRLNSRDAEGFRSGAFLDQSQQPLKFFNR